MNIPKNNFVERLNILCNRINNNNFSSDNYKHLFSSSTLKALTTTATKSTSTSTPFTSISSSSTPATTSFIPSEAFLASTCPASRTFPKSTSTTLSNCNSSKSQNYNPKNDSPDIIIDIADSPDIPSFKPKRKIKDIFSDSDEEKEDTPPSKCQTKHQNNAIEIITNNKVNNDTQNKSFDYFKNHHLIKDVSFQSIFFHHFIFTILFSLFYFHYFIFIE